MIASLGTGRADGNGPAPPDRPAGPAILSNSRYLPKAACAAASLAIGTRNGEQLT